MADELDASIDKFLGSKPISQEVYRSDPFYTGNESFKRPPSAFQAKTLVPLGIAGASLIPGVGPLTSAGLIGLSAATAKAMESPKDDPLGTFGAGAIGAGSAYAGGKALSGIGSLLTGKAGKALSDVSFKSARRVQRRTFPVFKKESNEFGNVAWDLLDRAETPPVWGNVQGSLERTVSELGPLESGNVVSLLKKVSGLEPSTPLTPADITNLRNSLRSGKSRHDLGIAFGNLMDDLQEMVPGLKDAYRKYAPVAQYKKQIVKTFKPLGGKYETGKGAEFLRAGAMGELKGTAELGEKGVYSKIGETFGRKRIIEPLEKAAKGEKRARTTKKVVGGVTKAGGFLGALEFIRRRTTNPSGY